MKDKEIQFNANDFLGAVEDVRDHLAGDPKLSLRCSEVKIPEPAPEISPEEIVAARESLRMSQSVFARFLNVPTVTAVSWEKGRRKPSGAALRLLQVAIKHPEAIFD